MPLLSLSTHALVTKSLSAHTTTGNRLLQSRGFLPERLESLQPCLAPSWHETSIQRSVYKKPLRRRDDQKLTTMTSTHDITLGTYWQGLRLRMKFGKEESQDLWGQRNEAGEALSMRIDPTLVGAV